MEDHTEEAKIEEEAARLPVRTKIYIYLMRLVTDNQVSQVKIAIWASLIANFSLCVLQSESITL